MTLRFVYFAQYGLARRDASGSSPGNTEGNSPLAKTIPLSFPLFPTEPRTLAQA